ncbi:hypothetical protein N7488_000260 [Penicillium malachiteum]|nr:hypothetical protein N7488_000260 [Penicillium malachiteum]
MQTGMREWAISPMNQHCQNVLTNKYSVQATLVPRASRLALVAITFDFRLSISTEGGDYSALLSVIIERENINNRITVGYTILGEEFSHSDIPFPAIPEDAAFAKEWISEAEKFLASGKIKGHPVKLMPHGFKGIPEGLDELRDGNVSGEKLVYNVSETL